MIKLYETYIDSKIEWFGKIPQHWNVTAIKNILKIPITDGPHTTPKLLDKGIPFISAESIKNRRIDFDKKRGYISQEDYELFSKKYLPKINDIYMVKSGATTGNIAIVETNEPFTIWSPLAVFRADGIKILPEFLFQFLQSTNFNSSVEISWSYGTQQNIGMGVLSNLPIVYPSLKEQTKITEYLLQEQRQAIINEAVTKGLNPNAKMKDSGIEWLGEIPLMWKIVPLKLLADIKYGLGQPPKTKEDGLPLIRATNVERGKINTNKLIFVDPDDVPYERDPILKEDDIIVVRSGAYTADSAIIPKEFDGAITGYDMVVRAKRINAKLLAFSLLSNYLLQNQLFLKRSRAAQPHLNAEELGESFILLPSQEEQSEIVDFLNKKTIELDIVINKTNLTIQKLKEYRRSIISEAVTGKVDVRDWQAPIG